MAALTKNRNTPERSAELRQFVAETTIYCGSIVALNNDGKAVAATDTNGLAILGIALTGAKKGNIVTVKRGCFRVAKNEDITPSAIGKNAYVLDDQTVGLTSTNSIVAGRIFDLDTKGVWILFE